MNRDPLFHDERPVEKAASDPQALRGLIRMQWLKLATGGLALLLILAIGLFWRFG